MGPRLGGRLATLGLLAAAVTVVAVAVPVVPAAADQTLEVGTVISLAHADAAASVPADGRINGYGFSGRVNLTGFVTSMTDTRAGRLTAASDAELAVVDLSLKVLDGSAVPWLASQAIDGPAPTATLIIGGTGGTRVSLPMESGLFGGTYFAWAAGVPKGAPVALEVARAGFAQDFDLRARRRLGPPVPGLYRDATNPFVTIPGGATQAITATTPAGTVAPFQIRLDGAALSFFPSGAVPATLDTTKAYLVVSLSGDPPDTGGTGDVITVNDPLPATAVRLVLPDGTTRPAAHDDNGLAAPGLLTGYYSFQVPAGLTRARITVQPGDGVAAVDGTPYGTGTPLTLAFAGAVTFDITIPDAPTPNPATLTPPPAPVGSPRLPAARHHGDAAPFGWLVLAALAALAGVVLAAVTRRRIGLAVRAVVHTQAALMAAAGPPALTAGVAFGALPAAPAVIDIPPPDGETPRPMAGPRLVVLVLGPLQVEGLRQPIRRKAVIRLLIHLALNVDRAVPSDRVRFALATDENNEPSEDTVYNYASHLRRSLPEGILPGNQPGGYRLGPGVEVDWAIFQALVAQAHTIPADGPRLLTAALAQVRGEPLADIVWPGVEADVRQIVAAVETAARTAAAMFLAVGDARQAEWAIHQGLLASPGCPGLWEDRMVAAAAGSGYGLQRAWETARKVLGDDATLIEGTYQTLRTTPV